VVALDALDARQLLAALAVRQLAAVEGIAVEAVKVEPVVAVLAALAAFLRQLAAVEGIAVEAVKVDRRFYRPVLSKKTKLPMTYWDIRHPNGQDTSA
jgi:hypothetical protein